MAAPMDAGDDDYEDSDASDSGGSLEGDADEQERKHFLDVCWSLLDYGNDAVYDINRMQEGIAKLDPEDLKLWPLDRGNFISEMQKRVHINARFLAQLPSPDVCAMDLGPRGHQIVTTIPAGHRVASRNSSKVRSTLRQFVRDWAKEGEEERRICYGPLMKALLRYLPPPPKGANGMRTGKSPTVLCPGSGLGRLPFDLVRLGYAAQGNEFSYHMLLGSHLVLNRSPQAGCHVIFPFVLSTTNRRGAADHATAVRIPDVCPCQVMSHDSQLSMVAGEFVQVYEDNFAVWDSVCTCFFLDTAKNVFQYIRLIAQITRPGGFWVNIGPLLYHYAEMPSEISIELSWEEVRPAIARYFDFAEEREEVAQYTSNPSSMMRTRYRCMFFVAKRNSVEVSGESNPVF